MRLSRGRRPATRWRFDSWSSAINVAHSPSRSASSATRTTPASWSRTPSFASSRAWVASRAARASSPGFTASSPTSASTSFASPAARPPTSRRPSSSSTRSSRLRPSFSQPLRRCRPGRRRPAAARLRERLRAALDALPSYHRAVIVMREIDGLSYEEMAQAMGRFQGYDHEPPLPRPSEAPARAGRLLPRADRRAPDRAR